ncbi:hypothetical protein TNCV_3489441 [Trichonephila clavipes]|nr:hypothetical protein TNCV_3489441 [Trichonephila clavipes]
MEIPLRTAYGQNGRCGMQPKAKHSLRAQAQLMRTETVETFELVKVKQKLLDIRAEKERSSERRTRELATLGHDFTPSYPKTECLPLAIPFQGEGNYPFPLAGVNGPSHSYTSPLKAHPSFQDDEAEKKL